MPGLSEDAAPCSIKTSRASPPPSRASSPSVALDLNRILQRSLTSRVVDGPDWRCPSLRPAASHMAFVSWPARVRRPSCARLSPRRYRSTDGRVSAAIAVAKPLTTADSFRIGAQNIQHRFRARRLAPSVWPTGLSLRRRQSPSRASTSRGLAATVVQPHRSGTRVPGQGQSCAYHANRPK